VLTRRSDRPHDAHAHRARCHRQCLGHPLDDDAHVSHTVGGSQRFDTCCPHTLGRCVRAVVARPAVAAWDVSDFASQSGRIWCGLTSDRALCHFPRGFRGVIPSGEEICPDEGLDVTGIVVTDAEPRYFCSGDPSAFPVKGREQVAWHVGTGYPFVSYDGYTLAVLPYGKAIRNGHYICASAVTGVTCANRATGHGFRIAQAGVTFF